MRYEIRCDKCGFQGEDNYIKHTNCPNCNHPLIIEDIQETNEIVNHITSHNVMAMKKQLSKEGSKKVWGFIEELPNPLMRADLRNIFLKVGGVVPKGKGIKI